MKGFPISIALMCAVACVSEPITVFGQGQADVVVEWNEVVLDIAEAHDGLLTLKGVRTAAMTHLAMHDALVSVNARYQPYVFNNRQAAADPVAAVSQAAFAVVSNQFPDSRPALKALNDRWLSQSAAGDSRMAGIELGNDAADAVLQRRAGDGWDTEADYQFHPMAPGVYAEFNEHSGTPQGFVFGAGWARATGFALTAPDQFRSPAPPDIDSEEYARAFDEVKAVGRFQSMQRTPDQTHLALWWKDFAERSHNRLARDLVARNNLPLDEAVRLFALLNVSIFDAYVSVFDNKFHYNHWRPYTAIRWAANDGNPLTEPEPTWTNTHRHTYAFPSYPSAHGAACSAAMSVFAHVFGDDTSFVMRTPTVDVAGPFSGKINMQPPTREFRRFIEAAMECSLSRVYLGIHFRYDSLAGYDLGAQVGENVIKSLLRERAR